MDESTHRNLISLLKLFKNRPYHLSKYLIDNDALSEDFLNKIKNSDKLSDLSVIKQSFSDITQMEDFYSSLLDGSDKLSDIKSNLTIDLNAKLKNLISEEKYEEAAALRDFMIIRNIKKND